MYSMWTWVQPLCRHWVIFLKTQRIYPLFMEQLIFSNPPKICVPDDMYIVFTENYNNNSKTSTQEIRVTMLLKGCKHICWVQEHVIYFSAAAKHLGPEPHWDLERHKKSWNIMEDKDPHSLSFKSHNINPKLQNLQKYFLITWIIRRFQ